MYFEFVDWQNSDPQREPETVAESNTSSTGVTPAVKAVETKTSKKSSTPGRPGKTRELIGAIDPNNGSRGDSGGELAKPDGSAGCSDSSVAPDRMSPNRWVSCVAEPVFPPGPDASPAPPSAGIFVVIRTAPSASFDAGDRCTKQGRFQIEATYVFPYDYPPLSAFHHCSCSDVAQMIAFTATILSLVLVNVAFAGVSLAAGFAAGWWVFRCRDTAAPRQLRRVDNDSERALMAACQIQDLAHDVAHDVGAHSHEMQRITHELEELRAAGVSPLDANVLAHFEEIQTANQVLQSQLAKAEDKIRRQAEEIASHESAAKTDALTGLNNRRAFDEEMKRRMAEWNRSGTSFSLLILDVDHFKKFNDMHGHPAGDAVLEHVGSALNGTVREQDLACRYGGEEFAVVMPSTPTTESKRAVERVRKTIEAMAVKFDSAELQVTASFGLTEVQAGDDVRTVIRRADDALYTSKEAGRNCSHYHDGLICIPITPGIQPVQRLSQSEIHTEVLHTLPLRTRFDQEVVRRVAESTRYGLPLSLMFIEMSNHEQVATDLGSKAADQMLDRMAILLRHATRDMDLLARDGKGRFAMMLPGSSEAEARQIAKRIGTSLGDIEQIIDGRVVRVESAIGFAAIGQGDTRDSLVERAMTRMSQSASRSELSEEKSDN